MHALNLCREERALLVARREPLIARMTEVADTAIAEHRGLTADDEKAVRDAKSALGRLDVEINDLDERIAELEQVQERTTARAGRPSLNTMRPQNPWQIDEGRGAALSEVRSRAITAVERAEHVPDYAKGRVVDAIERGEEDAEPLAQWAIATSDSNYLRAFQKALTDPYSASARMTEPEAAAFQRVSSLQRAMSLTDANGGYMVPFALDPSILLTNDGTVNPMRRVARTVTITSDTWNGVSSAGSTASWDAEAAEVSDDSPTLAQPSVKPHRLTAFIPYSIEAGMDAVNFTSEMAQVLLDAFDVAEGTAFWTGAGDGSNQPFGLITRLDSTTSVEIASTTADEFNVPDIYKLNEALPARFRANGTWAADIQVINKIRRFGEGTSGSNSAFWADLGEGQPPLLLGRPIVEASAMETFDGTGTENVLVFGDFSRYVIADRVGTTIEMVPHLFGENRRPTGQRGMFAYKRTGGDTVSTQAFRLLQT